ncbi:MAG: YafY family protein [Alphaproteobacteria bacterium]|nr:YafY family protein [Alphaproteobacteria bacterium]
MSKSGRLFEIIQILRISDCPMTAQAIADALEVAKRTVYRDITALQAMRVPIEGEAGIGYIMRPGYDLPPLMFDAEEIEAIVVGLAMLGRTRDSGLLRAAERAGRKIASAIPDHTDRLADRTLYASGWNIIPDSETEIRYFREAVRDEDRLCIHYRNGEGTESTRTILPLGMIYYVDAIVLAAWCELREDFRHFRIDRIRKADRLNAPFKDRATALRRKWRESSHLP